MAEPFPVPNVSSTAARRARVLIPVQHDADPCWLEWKAFFAIQPHTPGLALSRLSSGSPTGLLHAVGIGYGEDVCWFSPIVSSEERSAVLRHAAQVSAGTPIEEVPQAIAHLVWPPKRRAKQVVASEGILLLSHAETDLLALERTRNRLPKSLGSIRAVSLNDQSSVDDINLLLGPKPPSRFLLLARVHGRLSSVPGLANLGKRARSEGWHFVAISGVDDADPALAAESTVSAVVAATTTAYFMAGGVDNIAQAMRYLAAQCLGDSCTFLPPAPMPAHGLYHPDLLVTTSAEYRLHRRTQRPLALVIFYRAHVLSGNLAFIDALVRSLESQGFDAVGVFTSSLRETDEKGWPQALRQLDEQPSIIVNTVSYPLLQIDSVGKSSNGSEPSPFEAIGAPVLQAIACGTPKAVWEKSSRGLSPSETAVNIALPECDGRISAAVISFKENHQYVPDAERIERVAKMARRLVTLQNKSNFEKRISIVLTNSGGKAQKIGGAVGLDTPASIWRFLQALRDAGYDTGLLPENPDQLIADILSLGCYDDKYPLDLPRAQSFSRLEYVKWFGEQNSVLREQMRETWGQPSASQQTLAPVRWTSAGKTGIDTLLPSQHEPFSDSQSYYFAGLALGKIFIGLQPPRGFGVDPETVYHAPDLAPTHHYAAFYQWLRTGWKADAVIHFGKHGTLEWLPGKSVALSPGCAPDALLGDLPLFYPFVVNDPGEGAQAKRRAHAVIIDHLVPPLTQAESYGPLATLSRLVEEYYQAESLDPAKLPLLRSQIWDLVRAAQLEDDLREIRRQRHGNHTHEWDERPGESGAPRSLDKLSGRDMAHLLDDLDAYLCSLGRAQIRSGLHVFGNPPEPGKMVDLLFALVRCPNGSVPSLQEALSSSPANTARATQREKERDALGLSLLHALAERAFQPHAIADVLAAHKHVLPPDTQPVEQVLRFVTDTLVPALARTTDETKYLLQGLAGQFIPAGPSGAPSRGMAHVLPTGRNFYSIDPRGLPTPSAWTVGQALARDALAQYQTDTAAFPENIALSVWGTATMRTGGDDVAQALAFLGARPIWHHNSRHTIDVEAIPLAELGRPRIDVTLRVSGFFRDAFPAVMQLLDKAVRLVSSLDEPLENNFVRKHWLAETAQLVGNGLAQEAAERQASFRVFSSKPGAYGTGILELIENRAWKGADDLARAFLVWGNYAYGAEAVNGVPAEDAFRLRLASIDLALHNQDNREHDIFDSDDYFQFHGGLVAAISSLSGKKPRAYFGDSSNPAQAEVRTLQAEALRVYRTRVINPKWLTAIQQHGYKGGLEMAATIDYLFGFSATTDVVTDWMYEGVAESYTQGAAKEFLQRSNPWALHAICDRLLEAHQRGMWSARPSTIDRLRLTFLESESHLEAGTVSKS